MIVALDEAVSALDGRVADPSTITRARAVSGRASERLRLSGEHTVVALAGSTGSGKSTLFNALVGDDVSPVGVRRPTTAKAHAHVWGADRAAPLVQWLGVPRKQTTWRHGPGLRAESTDVDARVAQARDVGSLLLKLKVDLATAPAGASDDELRARFANLRAPLLALSKCPDFVVNRGHYFGTAEFNQQAQLSADEKAFGVEPVLSDNDKRALIAFLKTF